MIAHAWLTLYGVGGFLTFLLQGYSLSKFLGESTMSGTAFEGSRRMMTLASLAFSGVAGAVGSALLWPFALGLFAAQYLSESSEEGVRETYISAPVPDGLDIPEDAQEHLDRAIRALKPVVKTELQDVHDLMAIQALVILARYRMKERQKKFGFTDADSGKELMNYIRGVSEMEEADAFSEISDE